MSPLDKIFRGEVADIKSKNNSQVVNIDTISGYIGISRGYLINILRGRRRGDVSIIVRLCCVLGVSPERAESILHAAGYWCFLSGRAFTRRCFTLRPSV